MIVKSSEVVESSRLLFAILAKMPNDKKIGEKLLQNPEKRFIIVLWNFASDQWTTEYMGEK